MLTTGNFAVAIMLRMAQVTKIHGGKTPVRIHFIREWAIHRNVKQTDIVRNIDVDKSTVSRWFKGTLPKEDHLIALAGYLETEVPSLFRHPDDDWLAKYFRDKSEEQKEQAIRVLRALAEEHAQKTGTDA